MRTTSGGLNCALHVYALRVCLGLHLRARARSGQECEAYKVRHRGVPAANSMQNASAYSALCSYHYIDASPGDILENEKIIRRAEQRRKAVCVPKDPERKQARTLRSAPERERSANIG